MVTAIVLLEVDRERITEVAEQLAELPGIAEVYSVTGRFDLVAILRVKATEDMSDVVTKQMVGIAGIRKTETMLALSVHSRHDLEGMFALGFTD